MQRLSGRPTRLLTTVLIAIATALPQPAIARVQLDDTVKAGVRTSVEHDAEPFGYRVTWIEWDSYFRDSALQIGDRIVGVDGESYTRQDYRHHHAIGDYRENAYWEAREFEDGHEIELQVVRNGQPLIVPGRIRAERLYFDEQDRRTMDEGGPLRNIVEKDENGRRLFDSSWASWYERKINGQSGSFPFILDNGWERSGFNNQKALKAHVEELARVEYAVKHYPGTFTEVLLQDYERVRAYLEGSVVELPADALEFRTRAEEHKREVKLHSETAIARFNESLGDRLDESPGVRGGGLEALREAYVGKVAYFDGLTQRDIVNDLGQAFMVAGSDRTGFFFLRAESLSMARVFDVLLRYRSLVDPKLAERYSVWIDVQDEPVMINYKGSTVMGLLGSVAALAGGRGDVFIQASGVDGEFVFAGEEQTQVRAPCAPDVGTTPRGLIECMVAAIKHGDRRTWESLFADWRFTSLGSGTAPIFYESFRVRSAIYDRAWEHSRRYILGDVLDARVNRVGPVRGLHPGGAKDRVPKVDETRLVLDHVRLIDDTHRSFVDLNVRRVWRLQRLDGGQWKIADVQHL